MVPLANNIKTVCRPFIGLVEIPQNQGWIGAQAAPLERIVRPIGWEKGLAYCAFTASGLIALAYKAAGEQLPPQLTPNGSTSALARQAKRVGKLSSDPATGAIALEKGGITGWFHTEIVWDVFPDGTMLTFGANTTNAAGVQGVWMHLRNIADFDFVLS